MTDVHASKSSPQKYARKVATELFTREELSEGIYKKVGPITRKELSHGRCGLITSKMFKHMLL